MKQKTKHDLIFNTIEAISMFVTFMFIYNYGRNPISINFICSTLGVLLVAIILHLDAFFDPKYSRMEMFKDGIDRGWNAAIEEARKASEKAKEYTDG